MRLQVPRNPENLELLLFYVFIFYRKKLLGRFYSVINQTNGIDELIDIQVDAAKFLFSRYLIRRY